MEAWFNAIVSELSALGRTYPTVMLYAKILARIPREDWFVKVTVLKERDLSKLPNKEVYASLRVHEFNLAQTNKHKDKKTS